MHFEHLYLVTRIFVQPDFANPKHSLSFEKFRDERDDIAREFDIFGLLGVDAEPAIVRKAELGCALGLVFGQLAEVVVKPVRGTSIKARPECRLTDGGAASDNH